MSKAKMLIRSAVKKVAPTLGAMIPRANPVSTAMREVSLAHVSIKNLGYELGRILAEQRLGDARTPIADPIHVGLPGKATTQADIESPWLWHWCQQLHVPVTYQRKIWEYAYVLQILWEQGMIVPGKRGIGFGCGEEPIPSFLASRGVDVTITDQDIRTARKTGWADTAQHTGSIEMAFHADLVDRAAFDRHCSLRFVDMTNIDAEFDGRYDFCWSICAFEHLGGIRAGQDFVANAMKVLKPGGIAVHTTEFNLDDAGATYEGISLVLFQKPHLEEIAAMVRAQGDDPATMDFDAGDGPIDNFVDLPPYGSEAKAYLRGLERGDSNRVAHLKLSVAGYPTTAFGLWARRG